MQLSLQNFCFCNFDFPFKECNRTRPAPLCSKTALPQRQPGLCCCMSSPACRQQGDSGLSWRPASGQTDCLGRAAGEVPLVGNRFIWKEDVCLSTCYNSICVSVWWAHDTAWSSWLVVWPRVWFSMKTEGDTWAHTGTCIKQDPILPKRQISIVQPQNFWQCHFVVFLHAHSWKPDNQLYSDISCRSFHWAKLIPARWFSSLNSL